MEVRMDCLSSCVSVFWEPDCDFDCCRDLAYRSSFVDFNSVKLEWTTGMSRHVFIQQRRSYRKSYEFLRGEGSEVVTKARSNCHGGVAANDV